MKRLMLAAIVLAALIPLVSSGLKADQQSLPPNAPGMPTLARMLVINGSENAIPVVIQPGGDVQPVTVIGTLPVTTTAESMVGARAVRQAWEYRAIAVPSGQDPSSALNTAGVDGWEAVGVMAGSSGSTQVLLKRPR